MSNEPSRYKELGELHDLLLKACPPNEKGTRSIPALAKALGISHQYVYRWIEEKKIPPKFVTKIVALPGCSVAISEFHPFVF
jgi:hypothetical protein